MGQYTCDQCSEIPKIISTNIKNNTILIECRNHGLKELNINNYLLNSLNYNPHNWVCTKSQNIQKNTENLNIVNVVQFFVKDVLKFIN